MIQPIRKFSVFVTANYSSFTANNAYPVLAIDQTDDEDPTVQMLIVADDGTLEWLSSNEIKVASIDD